MNGEWKDVFMNHKNLDAWKLSIDLVTEIYNITKYLVS